MERLAILVTTYPRLVVMLVILVTAALATELRGIRPEVDLSDLIPATHPYVQVDREINERFGLGLASIIAIAPANGTIFDSRVLAKIERITNELLSVRGVIPESVMSLSSGNTRAIYPTAEGIDVGPLMRRIPETPQEMAILEKRVGSSPVAARNLVTPDHRGAMILANFSATSDTEALAAQLEAIAERERDSETLVLVGGQPTALGALDGATRGILPLLALSLVLVGLVHYEAFRTVQAVVLPLVTAAVAVVWSVGLARLLGFRVTPWTAGTTILVLSVAAGHAIQMLKRYYECLDECGDNKQAVIETLRRIGPVMVTAGAVAAAGFASLVGFGVPAVQDFGVIASCGIVSALIVEVTLIPAIRSLIPAATRTDVAHRRSLLAHAISFVAFKVKAAPGSVLAGVLAVVVAVSSGISLLRVDTAFRSWFDSNSEAIVADRAIRERFVGTSTIRLLIESDIPQGLHDPKAMRAIADIQRSLDADPLVSATLSVADFIRATNEAMTGAERGSRGNIPDDADLIAQYLLVLGTDSLSSLISADGRSAVIHCLAKTDSVEWAEALLVRASKAGDESLPVHAKLKLAGGELPQAIANNETVVREKLRNMAQVAAVIFVLSSLVLRSWVGGLIVLAPLVCAAAVNLGIMGWAGSRLSFATATYTSMGVSLGADFAIYLLFRIKEELARSSLEDGVTESLRTAGQAVVFVATAIAAGYATLLLSDFALWRDLGAYVGLMMLVSAVCTITLVPALVLLLRPRFLRRGNEQ
jgi:uncharacterized protein